MVQVILGEKGTGKTKRLIDAVHVAEAEAAGSVVLINKDDRHLFDVTHRVRLVNTSEFEIDSYSAFYGFICGMVSQNYDIAHIFIDSIFKIASDDLGQFEEFLAAIEPIAQKFNIKIVITASLNPSLAGAGILKFEK
ncbi:MAG: hypothetical protein Q4C12_08860 [Clostridia bacterium]|nr:hypothetical protein [Clostridia bacterium]